MADSTAAVARAEHAVTRLRAAAASAAGAVRLEPGISDEVIDAWPVPAPAEIRLLAREIGELWFDEYDPITFSHNRNSTPKSGRAGEAGTWWVLHTNAAAETYYVDIDPVTGRWGRVFSHWEDNSSTLVAASVSDWFLTLASGITLAAEVAAGERVDDLDPDLDDDDLAALDFETVFADWFHRQNEFVLTDETPSAPAIPADAARHSPDPEVAAAAADLPDDAVLADLRAAPYPTHVSFNELKGGFATYRRAGDGAFLAAVPEHW
ncbi:hypothetical protein ABZ319_34415 [Nocardia sp. NPDC005978]|uniref:hypothetical protein n=1 Tax=Nocardia sp. NPDC005978 TaxID=3156725 RepID=UPI0033B7F624